MTSITAPSVRKHTLQMLWKRSLHLTRCMKNDVWGDVWVRLMQETQTTLFMKLLLRWGESHYVYARVCVSVLVCDGGVLRRNPRRNLDDRLLLAFCVLHSISLSCSVPDSPPFSRWNPICQHIHNQPGSTWNVSRMLSCVRNQILFFFFDPSFRVERVKKEMASVVSVYFGSRETSCPGRKRACDSFSCPFLCSETPNVVWLVSLKG